MTNFDHLIKHRRDFQVTKFAQLHEHPCSDTEDMLLTVGTCLLMLAPILIIAIFAIF